MASSFLSKLPHTLDYDPREPVFTTTIMDKVIGFYSIDLFFFHAMLGYVVVQVMCTALASIAVYKFCVVKKKEKVDDDDSDKKKNRGVSPTMTSIIVGYCIIVPFWCLAPMYVYEAYEFKNLFCRFMLSAVVPVITVFKTTAAVHGFVPEQSTKSLSAFMFYYALPLPSIYDEEKQEYKKSTTARKIQLFKSFFTLNIVAGLVLSLYASNYFPLIFPAIGTHQSYDDWNPPSSTFFKTWLSPWRTYMNFMLISFYSMYMTMIASGLQLIQEILFGIETIDVMDNPIRHTKTPTEFWSKRWNVLVHDALKNGVYKPVRNMPGGSNVLGVFMTFFMSAVFHEWLLWVIVPVNYGTYKPLFGFNFYVFFTHGIMVVIDMAVTRKSKFLTDNRSVVGVCWLYFGISCFHWFHSVYSDTNCFLHGVPMHFFIREIVPATVQ